MSAVAPVVPNVATPRYNKHNYLNNGHGVKNWLLTSDHKRIALMYMWP
ncbi:hypothetical protein [Terriglobus sp. RCC_193]